MQDSDGEASDSREIPDEEYRALRQIAQDYLTNSMSRRAALALGAGATAGAAGMGGFAVGQASAQPTGDEGSLGTESDPVEAWISEANADSIDTGRVNRDWYASEEGGLQAAIDVASAGDRVIFDVDETISSRIEAKTGADIEGRNGATLAMADGADLNEIIRITGVSDITIEGMVLDGNKANQSQGGRGIHAGNAGGISDVRILNTTIKNTNIDCVKIDEGSAATSERIQIVGNTFIEPDGHAVVLGSSTDGSAVLRDVKINDNTLTSVTSDSGQIGLTAYQTNGTCENVQINDNTLRLSSANNLQGIAFEGPSHCEAVGNIIFADQNGLTASNGATECLFSANIVHEPVKGVDVRESGTSNITVGDNTFDNPSDRGIHFQTGSGHKATDNTITTPGSAAVRIESGVPDCEVIGNTVEDGGDYGIRASESAIVEANTAFLCQFAGILIQSPDCTVTGNICYDNGSGGTFGGIRLGGVTDCTVTGNRCYDSGVANQDYGVEGSNSPDHNVVVGNALRGNTSSATSGLGSNSTVANNGT